MVDLDTAMYDELRETDGRAAPPQKLSIQFTDVVFSPRLRYNILSDSRLRSQGFTTSEDYTKLYFPGTREYLSIEHCGGLYFVNFYLRDVFEKVAGPKQKAVAAQVELSD